MVLIAGGKDAVIKIKRNNEYWAATFEWYSVNRTPC